MKWFVYYSDDYDSMGGMGFESFDTQDAATEFIEQRLKDRPHQKGLGGYRLVKGEEQQLTVREQITKIAIAKSAPR